MINYSDIADKIEKVHLHTSLREYDAAFISMQETEKLIINKTCRWLEEEIAEYTGIDSATLIESYLKAMEE